MNTFEKCIVAFIAVIVVWALWTGHTESKACAAKGGVLVRGGIDGVCVKELK